MLIGEMASATRVALTATGKTPGGRGKEERIYLENGNDGDNGEVIFASYKEGGINYHLPDGARAPIAALPTPLRNAGVGPA